MSAVLTSSPNALAAVEAGLAPIFHLSRLLKRRLDLNHDPEIFQSERDLTVMLDGHEFEDLWTLAGEIEAKTDALRLELARHRNSGR